MTNKPVPLRLLTEMVEGLSDFLFVASRYVNERGKADVLWVPGKNR